MEREVFGGTNCFSGALAPSCGRKLVLNILSLSNIVFDYFALSLFFDNFIIYCRFCFAYHASKEEILYRKVTIKDPVKICHFCLGQIYLVSVDLLFYRCSPCYVKYVLGFWFIKDFMAYSTKALERRSMAVPYIGKNRQFTYHLYCMYMLLSHTFTEYIGRLYIGGKGICRRYLDI